MSIIARTTVYFMYKIVPYLNKIAHIQNLSFSLITVTNSETYPTFFSRNRIEAHIKNGQKL